MSKSRVSRRHFLKGLAASGAAVALTGCNTGQSAKKISDKTNILIITADQLSKKGVGAYGNPVAPTDHIDKIINAGTRFEQVHTPYPLCSPARASFWTGHLPQVTGVTGNDSANIPTELTTLGDIFSKAGYNCVHYGKRHDFGALRGFDATPETQLPLTAPEAFPVDYDSREDLFALQKALEFFQDPGEEPFLLAVEFNNPHNICSWVGAFEGPHGDIPGIGELPELPDNFEVLDWESLPAGVAYQCCNHFRVKQASHWTDKNYQQYLKAYYHYTGMGDTCIGQVMKALEKSGKADNTLVVFFSDHGDAMGSHRLVTKHAFFYEETSNVPFALAGPGIPKGKSVDALGSLCDLVPTLCDYAGLQAPEGIYGRSLMPLVQGEEPADWRQEVVSQWFSERNETTDMPARMLRTKDYKYTVYRENNDEQLFDLKKDPGENYSLVNDPAYSEVLADMRERFKNYVAATNDNFYQQSVTVDPQWRSHKPGYPNHTGGSAMDAIIEKRKAINEAKAAKDLQGA